MQDCNGCGEVLKEGKKDYCADCEGKYTTCSRCTAEVHYEDVDKCGDCQRDGLCPECQYTHDCEGQE